MDEPFEPFEPRESREAPGDVLFWPLFLLLGIVATVFGAFVMVGTPHTTPGTDAAGGGGMEALGQVVDQFVGLLVLFAIVTFGVYATKLGQTARRRLLVGMALLDAALIWLTFA